MERRLSFTWYVRTFSSTPHLCRRRSFYLSFLPDFPLVSVASGTTSFLLLARPRGVAAPSSRYVIWIVVSPMSKFGHRPNKWRERDIGGYKNTRVAVNWLTVNSERNAEKRFNSPPKTYPLTDCLGAGVRSTLFHPFSSSF